MGEAKRRRISGEMDYWYHGTDEHFVAWEHPPRTAKYKPELPPHAFISLSKDIVLARNAGEICGGLCRAKLMDSAKVLDLRQKSSATKEHWQRLLENDLAKIHTLVQDFDSWIEACSTGEVLRLHTTNDELKNRLGVMQGIANDATEPLRNRARARLEVQSFTRQWIDCVMAPAKEAGYQAVICAEVDRYRPGGKKACLNLYVFDPDAITPPDWMSVPDETLMLPYLEELKELGIS